MTSVLGRETGIDSGPTAHLGHYRARDGSSGAAVHFDVDGPHAALVVGKRGAGKSHTLGVLAEALARTRGVAPVVVDPLGVFAALADGSSDPTHESVPADVFADPAVSPAGLDPRSWCALLDLPPESGAGGLVWRAAATAETLPDMRAAVHAADADAAATRAAVNHLRLAASWGVFDADGLTAADLAGPAATVLDLSGLAAGPANAVVRALGDSLYAARVDERIDRLPWLLVDEAQAFVDGVAAGALRRVLTRGRAPGVSLVAATQRPSALPAVAVSQADVLLAHRLTSHADIDALERARPTYLDDPLEEQLPTDTGDAVVIDDATESVHAVRIRQRHTPHGGDSPSASRASAAVPGDRTCPPAE